MLAVVFGALGRRREDRVGFAYPHESLRGCTAVGGGVDVWVVRFREAVEGSGVLLVLIPSVILWRGGLEGVSMLRKN